jgi:cell division protein ZapA (FtsZ GTPase activity inhibitor)
MLIFFLTWFAVSLLLITSLAVLYALNCERDLAKADRLAKGRRARIRRRHQRRQDRRAAERTRVETHDRQRFEQGVGNWLMN